MEQSFVAWVAQRSRRLPQVQLGIGDDAALLSASDRDWVVTTDSLCEGTHFLIDQAGVIRQALYDVKPKGHAAQMVAYLREL